MSIQRQKKLKKRGPYHVYISEQRAEIGKYAVSYGITAAKRRYSKQFDIH